MVGEAARRQMPGVSVLPEAVHEQYGSARRIDRGRSLSHHGERYGTSGDDDLLAEPRLRFPVNELFDDSPLKDQ